MVESLLNLILLFIAIFLLFLGALQDWKTREIVDWIWVVMIVSGFIIHLLLIIILLMDSTEALEDLKMYLIPWLGGIIFALFLAVFYSLTGLGGEADRIAFIAIAFISPVQLPLFSLLDPKYDALISIIPRIFNVFCNTYILSISVPLLLFFYNLVRRNTGNQTIYALNKPILTKIGLYFIGYPRYTKGILEEIKKKPWHFDFLELYDEIYGWIFDFRIGLGTPEEDFSRLVEIAKKTQTHNKESIWVQPSFPLMVFFLLGFLTEILVGNLMLILLSSFF